MIRLSNRLHNIIYTVSLFVFVVVIIIVASDTKQLYTSLSSHFFWGELKTLRALHLC